MSTLQALRVCHVTSAYLPYPSGVGEYVHSLAAAQRAQGHDVRILTAAFGPDDPPEAGVTRIGRIIRLPGNGSFATCPWGWNLSGRVKRALAAILPDIVHLHGAFPPDLAYWALKHARCPAVMGFHSLLSGPLAPLGRVLARLHGRQRRRIGGRIALSHSSLAFNRLCFPGDWRVIPGGVDTDRFRPVDAPAGRQILFVGRLDWRKGVGIAIASLAKVRERVGDARLTVVGTGPMERSARQLVRKLRLDEAVSFHGYVGRDRLPHYFGDAAAFCAPSLGGEGFGLVLLEAMASGVPVAASAIPGYSDVVEDGRTGLLFPAGNATALADCLVRVLGDPVLARDLAERGRTHAESMSWTNVAAQVEQYYRDIIDRFYRNGGNDPPPAPR